ncbi:MAG: ADP-ribosylglycohydrolase family protein [Deltaproteobacteria bacterium]|nr:ADP-ribosylglycohydrolase family protein [Deltaproteobacteria bacterium]
MNDMTKDKFEGSLLGLALGDAIGAPLEGGPVEHFVWGLIGKTRKGELRWTDDTQMSLDLAEGLVAKGGVDPDDLAQRFAKGYRWSRGYGPGAAKLLKRISKGADWREANRSIFPDGSYGNGGAMRVAPVGLFYSARPEQLVKAARQSARVTHAHPLGIEGAVLVAAATAKAVTSKDPGQILQAAAEHCELDPFVQRLAIARAWLDSGQVPPTKDVSQQLGNGIAAARSCVTAVYIAAQFLGESFVEMQGFVAACGGDVDTIGAMAGAIWGAANGAATLPADDLARLEQRERIQALAVALYGRSADG